MLSLLAAWCVFAVISITTGAAVIAVTGWPDWLERRQDRFFAAAFTGLLACGSAALAVAPFLPLDAWLLVMPLGLLAIPAVRIKARASLPDARLLAVIAPFAIALAHLESGWDPLYDAALYHTQLIHWMSTYGLAPGLGLLHYRLGFSSSWLALAALLDHGFLAFRMTRAVTGFALLLILVQFSVALSRCGKGQIKNDAAIRDWYFAGATLVFLIYSALQVLNASPSPNIGAAAVLVFVGWLVIEGPVNPLALVVAGAAVAIKLSVAPAGLVLVQRAKPAVWALAAGFAAPLLLANYWTTGCPLFPASVCVDGMHSIPRAEVTRIALETLNYARNGGADYTAPYWNASWIAGWFAAPGNLTVFIPGALALAIIAALRSWNRAVGVALIPALYCALTAPGPRFVYGSVAVLVGAALAELKWRPWVPAMPAWAWSAVGTALILISTLSLEIVRPPVAYGRSQRWLMPNAAYLYGEPSNSVNHRGFPVNMPLQDDRCGALPLPCTPHQLDPATELCDRNRGLAGGFCRLR